MHRNKMLVASAISDENAPPRERDKRWQAFLSHGGPKIAGALART